MNKVIGTYDDWCSNVGDGEYELISKQEKLQTIIHPVFKMEGLLAIRHQVFKNKH